MIRSILYNSVTVNMPKNFIQYLLGFVLFWVVFRVFNPFIFIISLLSFLLMYSSVYLFNDIIDYEEDKEDKEKSKWKLIATGNLSVEDAMGYFILLLLAGLTLSVFVNTNFTLIMIALVFFNFLHSSTITRFKKSIGKTAVNMTIIEFLKFSTGWFAFTSNISKFPFWLILCFSIAYTAVYLSYKFKFNKEVIKRHKGVFAPMALVFLFSYTISFVIYNFSVPLLLLTLLVAVFSILLKTMKALKYRMKKLFLIEYIVLPLIIISFLLLAHPSVANINNSLTQTICDYRTNAEALIPGEVMTSINNISEIEDVSDISNMFNSLSQMLFLGHHQH